MSEKTVEQELCGATNIKRRSRESFQPFAVRLLDGIAALTPEQWDELSEAAQLWFNDAVTALDEDRSIAEWPDTTKAESTTEAPITEETPAAEETGTPAQRRGKERNTGKSSATGDKKKIGATWRMKEIIAKNPNISNKNLLDQMGIEGYKVAESTAIGILSDFTQSIRVLKGLDLWKGE